MIAISPEVRPDPPSVKMPKTQLRRNYRSTHSCTLYKIVSEELSKAVYFILFGNSRRTHPICSVITIISISRLSVQKFVYFLIGRKHLFMICGQKMQRNCFWMYACITSWTPGLDRTSKIPYHRCLKQLIHCIR